jgi:ATPase subunit of ABC transporter with duplicated ATPase domains
MMNGSTFLKDLQDYDKDAIDGEIIKKLQDYVKKASILVIASHSEDLLSKITNQIIHLEHRPRLA